MLSRSQSGRYSASEQVHEQSSASLLSPSPAAFRFSCGANHHLMISFALLFFCTFPAPCCTWYVGYEHGLASLPCIMLFQVRSSAMNAIFFLPASTNCVCFLEAHGCLPQLKCEEQGKAHLTPSTSSLGDVMWKKTTAANVTQIDMSLRKSPTFIALRLHSTHDFSVDAPSREYVQVRELESAPRTMISYQKQLR